MNDELRMMLRQKKVFTANQELAVVYIVSCYFYKSPKKIGLSLRRGTNRFGLAMRKARPKAAYRAALGRRRYERIANLERSAAAKGSGGP